MKRDLIFIAIALVMFLTAVFISGCTGNSIEDDGGDNNGVDPNGAKGAVIGYAAGWAAAPSDAQLDRLTHVMVFQLVPNADGSYENRAPNWLDGFVSRAHAKKVKVGIAVGGWTSESPSSPSYAQAAGANRAVFVNNLVNFVNEHNLDGIDIDWEYPPRQAAGWNDFISLCGDLKARMPGKRISAALSGSTPSASSFPGNVRSGIWTALDAIHIMSYDMQNSWPTHSDANRAAKLIDDWAAWGDGQPNFSKDKLILGCAFYGYSGNNQIPFKDGGGTGTDTPVSLKQKVDHCYNNGYGGVMIWELSQDKDINAVPELLDAIYKATKAKGGYKAGNR